MRRKKEYYNSGKGKNLMIIPSKLPSFMYDKEHQKELKKCFKASGGRQKPALFMEL